MTEGAFVDVSEITDAILTEIIVHAFDNDAGASRAIRPMAISTDRFLLRALGWALTRWPPPLSGETVKDMTYNTMREALLRRIDYDEERRKHIRALLEYNNRTLERARAAEAKLRSHGLAD